MRMMNILKIPTILALFYITATQAADEIRALIPTTEPVSECAIVSIPGQNGLGTLYVPRTLPQIPCDDILWGETPTTIWPDFGQYYCQWWLRYDLEAPQNAHITHARQLIVHAASQGTATAINYIAKNPEKHNYAALILEAAMLSGNTTITHSVRNMIYNHIWGGYLAHTQPTCLENFVVPFLVKFVHPFYNPIGEHPINTLALLPLGLPIIILHHRIDPQTPFGGAQAMYAKLRQTGHQNTYLIPVDGVGHFYVMREKSDPQTKTVHAILNHHVLAFALKSIGHVSNDEPIDLSIYQPAVETLLPILEDYETREITTCCCRSRARISRWIRWWFS